MLVYWLITITIVKLPQESVSCTIDMLCYVFAYVLANCSGAAVPRSCRVLDSLSTVGSVTVSCMV